MDGKGYLIINFFVLCFALYFEWNLLRNSETILMLYNAGWPFLFTHFNSHIFLQLFNSLTGCFNSCNVPPKSIQRKIKHSQKIDEGAWAKYRLFVYFLVEPQQKVCSNDYAADAHTCELPESYTPAIQHFVLP